MRWPLTATMIAIVSVALLLVVVSPFALRLFAGADSEWQRLSFIGQTYGAVSALIAVVALVGIVGTLVLQARETRRAVEESRRQAMSELLQKAMDDPDLDECWGPIPEPSDPKTRKQQLYINQIISQWGVAYETGAMPEQRLRAIAREMFSGRPGQEFWARARQHRLAVVTEGKKGRFNRILDEEYEHAPRLAQSEAGERRGGEAEGSRGETPRRAGGAPTMVAAVLAGGIGAGVLGAVAGAWWAGRRRTEARGTALTGSRAWRRPGRRTTPGR